MAGYEVSRRAIAQFAEAIGDPNPLYRDRTAAGRAGYPDVIAPPTFAVVVVLPASVAAVREALAGPGTTTVVHVQQRFGYSRPICAGDVLDTESAVTSIRELGGSTVVSVRAEVRAAGGESVCTAYLTLATLPER